MPASPYSSCCVRSGPKSSSEWADLDRLYEEGSDFGAVSLKSGFEIFDMIESDALASAWTGGTDSI